MSIKTGQGSFINNSFVKGDSITLTSKNPSSDFEPVFTVKTDLWHVDQAIDAAKKSYKIWNNIDINNRINHLLTLKNALIKNEERLALAISTEMGKLYSEALVEAKGLAQRIDLMINHGLKRVKTEEFFDLRAQTRYQSQGVLAIIGPFNFPAHLVHSHVIPSILLGNTVIIKPSEHCPWVSEIYAECFLESSLPKGVVNIVLGGKEVGEKLCRSEQIDGVIFTGSYKTGRFLQEIMLDQPHKILALELGGKNICVVMDDAYIPQALAGIIEGAFLTTGQRCTATSRVLVHKKIYEEIKKGLVGISADLKSCHAINGKGIFGPLANEFALNNYFARLENAKKSGVKVLLDSKKFDLGAYVTPSIYEINNDHPMDDYLSEELFGPNIAIESFEHIDDAINRVNQSPYGLSNAMFSLNKNNFEHFFTNTKSGLVNFNRSTNRAFGQLPFGGVNKSGNQRPAGIDAVRYASFPVAICEQAYGEKNQDKVIQEKVSRLECKKINLSSLLNRQKLELLFERFDIFSEHAFGEKIIYKTSVFALLNNLSVLKEIFDDQVAIDEKNVTFTLHPGNDTEHQLSSLNKFLEDNTQLFLAKTKRPNDINVPHKTYLPRTEKMLDRLYFNDFVPREKKALVVNLQKSQGPYLVSVDDDPLIIIDAASQIASVGAGLNASVFKNAHDTHMLDLSLLSNTDLSYEYQNLDDEIVNDAVQCKNDFEKFLHEMSHNNFKSISYGSSGAEANEIALDICRRNGPGGKKVIAFEGSFHGRTILSLHATYNKEKRGPFVFDGYESVFIPFPQMAKPDEQPNFDNNFLKSFYNKEIPKETEDSLLKLELKSLKMLKDELEKGNICAVIIEPMQCEGGDKYASCRFFNSLRGLTKAYGVPLIFDEVQTGFNLGRKFFWHQMFELKNPEGKQERPDCVTLGKKAQLGVCLSIFENQRNYTPHVVQLRRGLIHAQSICPTKALEIEQKTKKELDTLKDFFPSLVLNPRSCGYAFAFDMPDKQTATKLIEERFLRGFMAYIAGETTIRFRLNTSNKEKDIKTLFENIFCALSDIKNNVIVDKTKIKLNENKNFSNTEFISLTAENFAQYKNEIEKIENETYEKERRYSIAEMEDWFKKEGTLGVLLFINDAQEKKLAGFAIGQPAKSVNVVGPNDDPFREKMFYSSDCVIYQNYKGLGLGRLLKEKQIELVKMQKDQNQARMYDFLCGRNRVGFTEEMTSINDNLGAYEVKTYDDQYGIKGAKARYYRLPLTNEHHIPKHYHESKVIDCRNSLQKIFATPSKFLFDSLKNNEFRNLVCSKLTLSNWASTNMIRYAEFIRELIPSPLKHAYFTSGRDEVVDKGIRAIKFNKPQGQIVIGFSHQYFGNITAAARSLSHSEGQIKPFEFFDWPKISHPAMVGNHESKRELLECIDKHGKEKILAIVVELVGEKTGFTFDEEYLQNLDEIRKQTGIPLIFCENSSAYFRNGRSLFLTEMLSIKPNMMWWYTGGQLGHVFVDDQYYVDKPLTLISTWDGDDISILRSYNNLKHLVSYDKKIDFYETLKKEFSALSPHGMGNWCSVTIQDPKKLDSFLFLAQQNGVLFAKGYENRLMICPPLDLSDDKKEKITTLLKNIL